MQKFLPLLLVAVVAVAGCTGQTQQGTPVNGGQEPTSDNTPSGGTIQSEDCTGKGTTQVVNMTIYNSYYDPAGITVHLCDTIKINLLAGQGIYGTPRFTLDEYGLDVVATSTDRKNPVTFQFVADKYGSSGLFNYYCSTCDIHLQGLLTILK